MCKTLVFCAYQPCLPPQLTTGSIHHIHISTTSMFSRSAFHASRSAKGHTSLPSILSNVNLNPVAATAGTRVRRHSSSKASCPPGGSQPSAQAPEAVRPTSRLSRRRTKDTSDLSNTKARDGAFADLPAVPMTDNVAPEGKRSCRKDTGIQTKPY